VTQALQEARENPEYQRIVIDQENLQWAHLSHRAPLAGPEAVVSEMKSTKSLRFPAAIQVQTQSIKHQVSDDAALTVTDSVCRF